jgi:hypothetical protein
MYSFRKTSFLTRLERKSNSGSVPIEPKTDFWQFRSSRKEHPLICRLHRRKDSAFSTNAVGVLLPVFSANWRLQCSHLLPASAFQELAEPD